MLLFLIQCLLVFSALAFAAASLAFVVLLGRRHRRGVLVTGVFLAGALAGGFVIWQLLPATWTLPFWTTLKATVDSETYGHEVEHYAEGIVVLMTFAAVLVGSVSAGIAAYRTR